MSLKPIDTNLRHISKEKPHRLKNDTNVHVDQSTEDSDNGYSDPMICDDDEEEEECGSDKITGKEKVIDCSRVYDDYIDVFQKNIIAFQTKQKKILISNSSRVNIIRWLFSVSVSFEFCYDTFLFSISIFDNYASHTMIQDDEIQIAGISCLLIAMKINEVETISIKNFCVISGDKFHQNEIIDYEIKVGNELRFSFVYPLISTSLSFFRKMSFGFVIDETFEFILDCATNFIDFSFSDQKTLFVTVVYLSCLICKEKAENVIDTYYIHDINSENVCMKAKKLLKMALTVISIEKNPFRVKFHKRFINSPNLLPKIDESLYEKINPADLVFFS